MPFTFQIPKANINMLHRMYTILTPSNRLDVPGVSYGANVRCRPRTARTGVLKRVKTIKTEKIWRVFPVMYIPVSGQRRVVVSNEISPTKCVHRQLLRRGNRDFPRLLHLECVHLFGCWRLPCCLGRLCTLLPCQGRGVAGWIREGRIFGFRCGRRVEVEHPLRGRRRKLRHGDGRLAMLELSCRLLR